MKSMKHVKCLLFDVQCACFKIKFILIFDFDFRYYRQFQIRQRKNNNLMSFPKTSMLHAETLQTK